MCPPFSLLISFFHALVASPLPDEDVLHLKAYLKLLMRLVNNNPVSVRSAFSYVERFQESFLFSVFSFGLFLWFKFFGEDLAGYYLLLS